MKKNIKYLKRIKLINTLWAKRGCAMDFVIVDRFLLVLFLFWVRCLGGFLVLAWWAELLGWLLRAWGLLRSLISLCHGHCVIEQLS